MSYMLLDVGSEPVLEMPWWRSYDNIVMLTAWLARSGDADTVAHAVEKPWNYEMEYLAAELDYKWESEDPDNGFTYPDLEMMVMDYNDDQDEVIETLRKLLG